jgi:hypothetical protein
MANTLLVQNIIGRLTHGLVGLDLYEQEGSRNQYLEDFLSLEMNEVQYALAANTPKGLVPSERQVSLEDFGLVIDHIEKAKQTVKNLEKQKPQDIKTTIRNLKKTVMLLYGSCSQ